MTYCFTGGRDTLRLNREEERWLCKETYGFFHPLLFSGDDQMVAQSIEAFFPGRLLLSLLLRSPSFPFEMRSLDPENRFASSLIPIRVDWAPNLVAKYQRAAVFTAEPFHGLGACVILAFLMATVESSDGSCEQHPWLYVPLSPAGHWISVLDDVCIRRSHPDSSWPCVDGVDSVSASFSKSDPCLQPLGKCFRPSSTSCPSAPVNA